MPTNPTDIFELCHQCAEAVYSTRPPTPAYASRVTHLLFGTAVHESAGFNHSRQIGYSLTSPDGAWSYFQLEWPSITDSLRLLDRMPALALHVAHFLEVIDPHWFAPLIPTPLNFPDCRTDNKLSFLNLIRSWPRLAVTLARIHYLRDPDPIPLTIDAQAVYWKRLYNTHAGKGTPDQYIASWNRWATPILASLSRPQHESDTP